MRGDDDTNSYRMFAHLIAATVCECVAFERNEAVRISTRNCFYVTVLLILFQNVFTLNSPHPPFHTCVFTYAKRVFVAVCTKLELIR